MILNNRTIGAIAICGTLLAASNLYAQSSSTLDALNRLKASEAARRGTGARPGATPSAPTPSRPSANTQPASRPAPRPAPMQREVRDPKAGIEEVKRVRPELKKLSDIETKLSAKSQENYDELQMMIYNAVYDDKADIEKLTVLRSLENEIEKKFPLVPSQPLVEKTVEELNETAKLKTKEKYPETVKSLTERAAKEAVAKYPMDAVRTKVTLNYRNGPQMFSVTGTLYKITPKNILVGDTTVTFIDMDDETKSRFDKEMNTKLRNDYVQAKTDAYKKLRSDYALKIREELKTKQHLENEKNGYIYLEGDMRWTTAKALAQPIIEAEQKKLAKYKEYLAKVEAAEKAELDRIAAENEAAAAAAAADGRGAEIKVSVTDELYQKILAEATKKLNAVNSKYSGIDADQGYKNAFWGAKRSEVHTLLSREPEFKHMRGQIGSDVITMPEGEKPEVVELLYKDGLLYKTSITMGKLSQAEFDAYRNTIHGKNGRSDEENADPSAPLFKQIIAGEYKQEKPEAEEDTEAEKPEEETRELTDAQKIARALSTRTTQDDTPVAATYEDYTFTWTGKASKGVLTFSYDTTNKVYAKVMFVKEFNPAKAVKP